MQKSKEGNPDNPETAEPDNSAKTDIKGKKNVIKKQNQQLLKEKMKGGWPGP